jgi:hypothetical protein
VAKDVARVRSLLLPAQRCVALQTLLMRLTDECVAAVAVLADLENFGDPSEWKYSPHRNSYREMLLCLEETAELSHCKRTKGESHHSTVIQCSDNHIPLRSGSVHESVVRHLQLGLNEDIRSPALIFRSNV